MHFDPYESKKNRRKRILSDVLILLMIVMFLWGLYSVLFGARRQIRRYEFASCSAVEDTEGGNAAFAALCRNAATLPSDATLDKAFAEQYPIPAAMLKMETPYDAKTPYFRIDSERFVLAQTVLSEQTDERLLEIMTAAVKSDFSDGAGQLTLSDFEIVCLAYNARTGVLRNTAYSNNTFHLDLFGLSPLVKGSDVVCTGYTATLQGESLDSDKAKQLIYDPVRATYGDASVEKSQDGLTVSVTPAGKKDQEVFNISVANDTFLCYDSIAFSYTYQGDAPSLALIANRG